MKKEFNLEYEFDTTYYYNKSISTPSMVECNQCNGVGLIKTFTDSHSIVDGILTECQVCNGVGEIESGSGSITYKPCQCLLKKIKIMIWEDGDEDVRYHFVDNKTGQDCGLVFPYPTKKECEDNKPKGLAGYTK